MVTLSRVYVPNGTVIFDYFNQSTFLYLNNNGIVNFCLGTLRQESAQFVVHFDLAFNKVLIISKDCLHTMHTLTYLNISKNQIRSVKSHAFSGLRILTTLQFRSFIQCYTGSEAEYVQWN